MALRFNFELTLKNANIFFSQVRYHVFEAQAWLDASPINNKLAKNVGRSCEQQLSRTWGWTNVRRPFWFENILPGPILKIIRFLISIVRRINLLNANLSILSLFGSKLTSKASIFNGICLPERPRLPHDAGGTNPRLRNTKLVLN